MAQDPGAVYANFYVANDSVFMPESGDRKADDRAPGILQERLPDRDVVPVVIDTVASGGGGIHCATRDQPGEPATDLLLSDRRERQAAFRASVQTLGAQRPSLQAKRLEGACSEPPATA